MFEQIAVSLVVKLVMTAAFVFLGFVLEDHLRARKPASGRAYGQNVRLNLALTVMYFVVHGALAVTVAGVLASLVRDLPGSGFIRLPIPDEPAWRMVVIAVVVGLVSFDFFFCWLHRVQHRWGWLWKIHELHHSDEHTNVTTTYRHHWLQVPLDAIAIGVPLGYVFAPPPTLPAAAALVGYALGHFVHLNARIRLRPIRWLLVSPQHHRVHHSSEPVHRGRNFASIFPFWDLLFGTYYGAARDEHPETGLMGERQVAGLADAVAWPWRSEAPASLRSTPTVRNEVT